MKNAILGALCAILLPLNVAAQHWHRFLKRPSSVTVEQLVADTTVNRWQTEVDADLVASMQSYLDVQTASANVVYDALTKRKQAHALQSVKAGRETPITQRTSVRDGVMVGYGGATYVVSDFPEFQEATDLRFIETKTKAELTAWLVDVLALPAPDRLYRDVLVGAAEHPTFCVVYGCEPSMYADPASTCTLFTASIDSFGSEKGHCTCDPNCKEDGDEACIVSVDLAVVVVPGNTLCFETIGQWWAISHPLVAGMVGVQRCDAADETREYAIFGNNQCTGEPLCTISIVIGCQNCNLPCTFPF